MTHDTHTERLEQDRAEHLNDLNAWQRALQELFGLDVDRTTAYSMLIDFYGKDAVIACK